TVAIETPASSAICLIVLRRVTWAIRRLLKHVPERFGNSRKLGGFWAVALLDFHLKIVVNGSGNVFGPTDLTDESPDAGRERTADATQAPLHPLARSCRCRGGLCSPRDDPRHRHTRGRRQGR